MDRIYAFSNPQVYIDDSPLAGAVKLTVSEKKHAKNIYEIFNPEPWAVTGEITEYELTFVFKGKPPIFNGAGYTLRVGSSAYEDCEAYNVKTALQGGEQPETTVILSAKRKVELSE